MKKLIVFILALVLGIFCLASCDLGLGGTQPGGNGPGDEVVCEHTGGTATCVSKAICSKCGEAYGDYSTTHSPETEWSYADGKHYHACAYGCSTRFDEAACDGVATCKDAAKCSVCGNVRGTPDSSKHVISEEWTTFDGIHYHACENGCGKQFDVGFCDKSEADCYNPATCKVCGKTYGDPIPCQISTEWSWGVNEDGQLYHYHSCENGCDKQHDAEVCNGDAPTCTAAGSCDVCGGAPVNPDNHKAATEWTTDSTNGAHYHECENGCGEKLDVTDCVFEGATCITEGECVCGNVGVDTAVGHNWIDEYITGENGTHYRECENGCGVKDEQNCVFAGATCSQSAKCEYCDKIDFNPEIHKVATEWTVDSTNRIHYHACEYGCEQRFDSEECVFKNATCVDPGNCDVCGSKGVDLTEDHKASDTLVANPESMTHSVVCEYCHVTLKEEDCTFSESTCTTAGKCDLCDNTSIVPDNHKALDTALAKENMTHSFVCEYCHVTLKEENCTFSKSTCTTAGKCDLCDNISVLEHEYNWNRASTGIVSNGACKYGCGSFKHINYNVGQYPSYNSISPESLDGDSVINFYRNPNPANGSDAPQIFIHNAKTSDRDKVEVKGNKISFSFELYLDSAEILAAASSDLMWDIAYRSIANVGYYSTSIGYDNDSSKWWIGDANSKYAFFELDRWYDIEVIFLPELGIITTYVEGEEVGRYAIESAFTDLQNVVIYSSGYALFNAYLDDFVLEAEEFTDADRIYAEGNLDFESDISFTEPGFGSVDGSIEDGKLLIDKTAQGSDTSGYLEFAIKDGILNAEAALLNFKFMVPVGANGQMADGNYRMSLDDNSPYIVKIDIAADAINLQALSDNDEIETIIIGLKGDTWYDVSIRIHINCCSSFYAEWFVTDDSGNEYNAISYLYANSNGTTGNAPNQNVTCLQIWAGDNTNIPKIYFDDISLKAGHPAAIDEHHEISSALTSDGTGKHYYACVNCDTKFFESDCTAAEEWLYGTDADGNVYHYHACEYGCGYELDKAICVLEGATCTEKAVCGICNRQGEIDPQNHKNADAWISGEDGTHYHACEYGCGEKLDVTVCTMEGATCSTEGTCTICGYVGIDETVHKADEGTWISDENGTHYRACEYGCEEKLNVTMCAMEGATCSIEGECEVCGYEGVAAHKAVDSWISDDNSTHYHACEYGCGEKLDVTECTFIGEICMLRCEFCENTYIDNEKHKASAEWFFDSERDTHYHVCAYGCGEKFDEEDCFFQFSTCIVPSPCLICDNVSTTNNHVISDNRVAIEGTLTHSTVCSRCGTSLGPEECTFSNSTCAKAEKCDYCDNKSTNPDNHKALDTALANEDMTHSLVCEYCHESFRKEYCTFSESTCTMAGKCDLCDNTSIVPDNHKASDTALANENMTHSVVCEYCNTTLEKDNCTFSKSTCTIAGKCDLCDNRSVLEHEYNWNQHANSGIVSNGACIYGCGSFKHINYNVGQYPSCNGISPESLDGDSVIKFYREPNPDNGSDAPQIFIHNCITSESDKVALKGNKISFSFEFYLNSAEILAAASSDLMWNIAYRSLTNVGYYSTSIGYDNDSSKWWIGDANSKYAFFELDRWYDIEVIFLTDTGTVITYVDGEEVGRFVVVGTAFSNLQNVVIYSSGYALFDAYLDDFVLEKKD